MLPVVLPRGFSCDDTTRYLLPVLWMTSCFHIMGQLQIHAWESAT